MNGRLLPAWAVLLALVACTGDGEGDCRVNLRFASAMTAIPEGYVREVPLMCGDGIVGPRSGHIDRLESVAPDVASVVPSLWRLSSTDGREQHDAWYVLAHKPGGSRLKAWRGDELVAEFALTVVAQDAP